MKASDFPFTSEAALRVREMGYTLDSLLHKTSFKNVRTRALERVDGAIRGTILDRKTNSESEDLAELLSYPLARVMVSCLGSPIIFRRYALAEAKLAYKRMQKDEDNLIELARDQGIHPQGIGPYRLHFVEFIHAASKMHSLKWKLANRDLKDGYLTVTNEEIKRLLEERAREKVLSGLPLAVDEKICGALSEYLAPLQREMQVVLDRQKVDLGKVGEGAFPPCMKKMLSEVKSGINLAHSARFALVSFLLNLNMSVDEIVSLFNTSPDFDSEKTRYQVEHIAGSSGIKYKPPSCATMATYGNCPGENDLCRKVHHPLSYIERYVRRPKTET